MKNAGISLIEVTISLGIMAAGAMALNSYFSQSSKQLSILEQKYAKLDVDQSLRGIFSNNSLCGCNFASVPITAGATSITLPRIAYFRNDCSAASAKDVIVAGQTLDGISSIKVNTIKIANILMTGPDTLTGDLEVTYTQLRSGPPIKGSRIKHINFELTGSGAARSVSSCQANLSVIENKPSVCGNGLVCFPSGKRVQFNNAAGAPVQTYITGTDSTGTTIGFTTPAGRTTMMKFREDVATNQLLVTTLQNWKPQFCFTHPAGAGNDCSYMCHFKKLLPNCGSPLFWTGDYTGNTGAVPGYVDCNVSAFPPPVPPSYCAGVL